MNNSIANDYELYRRWFERSLELIWQLPASLRLTADPMLEVAKAEKVSQAKAVKSLTAGIKDTAAMTDRYSLDDVHSIDKIFMEEGLPSLTAVRAIVSSYFAKIVKKGVLSSDEEFFSLKALEDCDLPEDILTLIRRLLATYELNRH